MKLYLVVDITEDFNPLVIGCYYTEKEAEDIFDAAPDEKISPFTDDGEDETIEIWEVEPGRTEGQVVSKTVTRIWLENKDGIDYWETRNG